MPGCVHQLFARNLRWPHLEWPPPWQMGHSPSLMYSKPPTAAERSRVASGTEVQTTSVPSPSNSPSSSSPLPGPPLSSPPEPTPTTIESPTPPVKQTSESSAAPTLPTEMSPFVSAAPAVESLLGPSPPRQSSSVAPVTSSTRAAAPVFESQKHDKASPRIIVPVVLVVAALIICGIVIWMRYIRRRRRSSQGEILSSIQTGAGTEPTTQVHSLSGGFESSERQMGERENQDTFEKEGSKAVRSSNKRNAAQQFQVVTRKLDAIEEAVKAVGRNRSGWANRTDDWDGQEAGYGWGLAFSMPAVFDWDTLYSTNTTRVPGAQAAAISLSAMTTHFRRLIQPRNKTDNSLWILGIILPCLMIIPLLLCFLRRLYRSRAGSHRSSPRFVEPWRDPAHWLVIGSSPRDNNNRLDDENILSPILKGPQQMDTSTSSLEAVSRGRDQGISNEVGVMTVAPSSDSRPSDIIDPTPTPSILRETNHTSQDPPVPPVEAENVELQALRERVQRLEAVIASSRDQAGGTEQPPAYHSNPSSPVNTPALP
ncbi:hypothetical protein D9756_007910 [Leucocoprinus leucothites]|uniref:Uncharacterized protein n=1 Tax=Leucocoprinus leucothites TaxID=201217 RepID=A0A8H5FY60_9AGAR|nr:hypothetical protein D9756_007910 [Leucoagaricus leucothites]